MGSGVQRERRGREADAFRVFARPESARADSGLRCLSRENALVTTAGYSGTPLPRKLGPARGRPRGCSSAAPDGFEALLEPLPAAVTVSRRLGSRLDAILFFATRRAEIERRHEALAARLTPAGMLWLAWPKRASGVTTDVTEDVLRDVILPSGMVDTKVCAIDETWSGLRFVRRKELR